MENDSDAGCAPRRHRAISAARLIGLIVLVPHAAQAQIAAPATAPARPRVSVGIADKPLTLGVRHEVLFDSNVVQGSAEAARLRRLRPAEFITTPSATLDYAESNGRIGVAVTGIFGYDFHERNTILDRERVDASASAAALVGASCLMAGKGNYWRKQTRQQDLTTIVTDNTVKFYRATLEQSCVSPAGLIETVQVLRSAWHNSSVLNINNDRHAVSGLFGYTDPGFGTLGVTVLYERTDFSGRPAILVMTPDTLEKTGIGLRFASPAGQRLVWSVDAGYAGSVATVSPGSRLAGRRRREGPVAQGELAYSATNRLRISASIARRIRHDTSFTVTTDAQAAAEYALSPGIQASIGGRWLRDRYYGRDTTLPQIAQDRQEQTTIYGTMTVRVGRRTSLAADLRHDVGRADFAPFRYSGNRVSLVLTSSLAPLFSSP